MTLSKQQTDEVILEKVKESDNDLQQINIRNTSNVHPLDCKCEICIRKKFDNGKNENEIKGKLNYYKGDSYQ